MFKINEKLIQFIKNLIQGEIKVKKRFLFLVAITILIFNILISIPVSYITKDYNHFAFAIGEAIIIPIMALVLNLIRLTINLVKIK